MRCKACNNLMDDYELVTRHVKTEDGTVAFEEDLCRKCRTAVLDAEGEDISPESIGLDVFDDGQYYEDY